MSRVVAALCPPSRAFRPLAHLLDCPAGRFVGVTRGARIRHLVLLGFRGRDKREGVRAYVYVGNRGLNLRHVTRHAFASRRSLFVVRVLRHGWSEWPIGRVRRVAVQTNLVGGLP